MVRPTCALTLALGVIAACGSSHREAGSAPEGGLPRQPGKAAAEKAPGPAPSAALGLSFALGEGVEGAGRKALPPAPPSSPLDAASEARVLSRLPPLSFETSDRKPFALRERSLPAPRAGKTVREPFPPSSGALAPGESAAGPLQVLRHMPDGEVPLAPHVSLTFSQPMVPVTSLAELEKLPVPAKLTPQPPGRWRWIGAKTLLFEPAPELARLPMSTEYEVEVPAGTISQNGGKLASAERFKFTTPALQLQQMSPNGSDPARPDPVVFASFDQRIEPSAVFATVKMAAGGKSVPVELASAEAIRADATASRLLATLEADGRGNRALVFRPTEPLPPDSEVRVTIGPGTPSAEGPRRTEKVIEGSFRTYGPMRIAQRGCDQAEPCQPGDGFWTAFSNPIDPRKFTKDMVTLDPPLPAMKVVAHGNQIFITGQSRGRSVYRATFAASLPDAFGQTLGRDQQVAFHTGPTERALFALGGTFVVVDPDAGHTFSVFSVNQSALKVKAYAQTPDTWQSFSRYVRDAWNRDAYPPEPPGPKVLDQTVSVKGEPDALTETRIDLGPALSGNSGNLVLLVEPAARPKNRWEWTPVLTWLQLTPIGLDAVVDGEKLIGWATDLKTGQPLEGAELTVKPTGASARTGAAGTASIALGSPPGSMLVARHGGQTAFLPESTEVRWGSAATWQRSERGVSFRWYVADDRQMYKPGEQVKLKGWIRRLSQGPEGDVAGWPGEATRVAIKLRDSRGNEVAKAEADVNALGGFDASVELPDAMNLGHASFTLEAPGAGSTSHAIQVQEFRRPEFEVSAQPSEGPFFVGAQATVALSAKYFAGGALPSAEVHWSVSAQPGTFTPPNRGDFAFGTQPSWWGVFDRSGASTSERFEARTDSSGKHVLRIDFLSVNPPRPTLVAAQGTVMDVNRQAWSAAANLLVHPASLYVGLKAGRPFVQQGEPIAVDAIAADLDGKLVPGRSLQIRVARLEREEEDGELKSREKAPKSCNLISSDRPERCTVQASEGGLHRITASIQDDKGRRNQTQIEIWVAGGDLPPSRDIAVERVRLLPDKKEYRAGETAQVLVVPPFYPAQGLLTLRRQGVFKVERFEIAGPSHTLSIPIEDAWTPNVTVGVDLVGQAKRTGDRGEADPRLGTRPAVAEGSVSLSIPPLSRRLDLEVRPRDAKLEPGGETVVDLTLRGAQGEPVAGGEVAVVIVDEAVLSLTGYRLPDPLAAFYPEREPGARDYHLRESLLLARPEDIARSFESARPPMLRSAAFALAAPAPHAPMMKEAAEPAGAAAGIRVRADFNALATFAPAVRTDAAGHAQVPVKLPDNLTRYRVMAVAAAGSRQFGQGESAITARLPIMVRPSAPRFLNFGDRLEMPVVVQNQTDAPVEVDVAMRATNARLTAGAGRRVKVAANDRAEIRFPMSAEEAGRARFQFAAVASGNPRWADAAQVQVPVWTPATTEAFATYGTLEQGAVRQSMKMPEGVFPQFGGLEITTSSTALQSLTDAVLYLARYPFECSEQMSSRVLAVASLRDVLSAFKAEGLPPPEAMVESVKKDLEMLARLQNDDGGWGFWRRGDESWPFLTLHVAHAFSRAKDKGFGIPQAALDRARPYLQEIESHIPGFYPREARQAIIAYSLYVRQRLGDVDSAKAQRLVREAGGVEKLPLEAVAWLYPVVSGGKGPEGALSAIRRVLQNRVEETAGAAHFATSYGDGSYLILHSNRRVDALFLEGLIGDQPKSDLIPKLVEGLLGHREAGHWESTQENAWVLLALDRYFNTYEKVTPDFVARVWLGAGYAGDHAFRGRSTDRAQIEIPMSFLAESAAGASTGAQDLVVAKEGAGRLYYRIGMSYALRNLSMPPRDNGFVVQREYEAVDDPGDVRKSQDGTWRVKAGARVRVRLTMVAPARRTHVALVDPLPAGLEALSPALKTTGELPKDPKDRGSRGGWWWWRPWYEHQNLRDERAEAFTSLLWEGVHTYSYVARATIPGSFVAPPPKAEEMYHPETFGRGSSDRLVVE
jgi:uncharacterized protein YfaS (alpha-2-macroglobulin family)